MSKIGRKPIAFSTAKIEVSGKILKIAGAKASFEHELPEVIVPHISGKTLQLELKEATRENRVLWGLHRALVANKVKGVETGFETKVSIVGLGFKAQPVGSKFVFSLGYTHKIDLECPKGVTIEVDKTGQQLVVKSADKFLLGNVCDAIRSFRPPEPYKGTGIIRQGDVIVRKAGKTKSA
ncbi:MAG: 50S ribosomal protein L6 [Candidatus Babeliales bacterium]|jgi:large subunit ribosomal protein L6